MGEKEKLRCYKPEILLKVQRNYVELNVTFDNEKDNVVKKYLQGPAAGGYVCCYFPFYVQSHIIESPSLKLI